MAFPRSKGGAIGVSPAVSVDVSVSRSETPRCRLPRAASDGKWYVGGKAETMKCEPQNEDVDPTRGGRSALE